MANLILKKNGKVKEYIYKTDIQSYLDCSYEDACRIFELVKEYEIDTYELPFFETRVPQELFHEFRKKRRKK